MCQENKKHKSGTASDSCLKTKRGNIISGPLVTVIPCCAPPGFIPYLSPFRHSCTNGSSSEEHLSGKTLPLVNSETWHVHSANDLQAAVIVIVRSLGLPFCFLNCFKPALRKFGPPRLSHPAPRHKHQTQPHPRSASLQDWKTPNSVTVVSQGSKAIRCCWSNTLRSIWRVVTCRLKLKTVSGDKIVWLHWLWQTDGLRSRHLKPPVVTLHMSNLLFPFIPHISVLFSVSALFTQSPRSYKLSWLLHLTQRTTLVLRWVQFWFGLEATMKPKHAKNSQCKALNQSCCLFEPFYTRTQDTYHYVYGQSNLGISPAHDLSYLFLRFLALLLITFFLVAFFFASLFPFLWSFPSLGLQ